MHHRFYPQFLNLKICTSSSPITAIISLLLFHSFPILLCPVGSLVQLRALDWNMNGPFQTAPIVTVYHPIPSPGNGGHPFANIGFLGLIGSITGYSSAPVGICEKVMLCVRRGCLSGLWVKRRRKNLKK